MHTYFYSFTADTVKDIGNQVGETFRAEITLAMEALQQSPKWKSNRPADEQSLAFTKQYFPAYVEELEGYATGANLALLDAWSLCIEDESEVFVEEDNASHCTSIITNKGLLIGHNEDAGSEFDQDKLSVVQKVLPQVSTLELFYATTLGGTSIGVNSHGYAQAINTLFHTDTHPGVPRVVISHFLLQTADPEKDLSFAASVPKMSGYHHAITKNTGEVWTVEFNSSDEKVRKQPSEYVHTNHCVFDPSKTFPDDWGTQTRYQRAKDLVHEQMSREELTAVMRDTSTDPKKIFNKYTMGQAIIDFSAQTAYLWLRRESDKGFVSYPLP